MWGAYPKVFTTGQAAKRCHVAPKTLSDWFDDGRLEGYRIPGSQDRRIPVDALIKFLRAHGMPLGDLEDAAVGKILVISESELCGGILRELLPRGLFRIVSEPPGFGAGVRLYQFRPDCLVLDISIGRNTACSVCSSIRARKQLSDLPLFGLLRDGSPVSCLTAMNGAFNFPSEMERLTTQIMNVVRKNKSLVA